MSFNFYSVLFYALLIDITFYIFRFGWLNRANVYREPHFYLFVHMIIHEVFVWWVWFELYVAFSSDSESSKMRDDMGKLTVPLILIALRTFFYFVITILVLLFSPWILCGIVSNRRQRLRLIQELQFERRNGSIVQYARNSIADNAQDFLYDNQQPLNNNYFFNSFQY